MFLQYKVHFCYLNVLLHDISDAGMQISITMKYSSRIRDRKWHNETICSTSCWDDEYMNMWLWKPSPGDSDIPCERLDVCLSSVFNQCVTDISVPLHWPHVPLVYLSSTPPLLLSSSSLHHWVNCAEVTWQLHEIWPKPKWLQQTAGWNRIVLTVH